MIQPLHPGTLTVLLWIQLALSPSAYGEEPPSQGLALELKALESLKKIQSGRVVFFVESTIHPADKPSQQALNHKFTVEFDFQARKNRTEYVLNRWGKRLTKIDNGQCYTVAEGLEERLVENGSRIQILDHALAGTGSSGFGYLDVRLLGIYPMPVFVLTNNKFALESVLGSPVRFEETVADDFLDEEPVKHISYCNKHGAWIQKWIAPRLNYAVIKTTADSKDGSIQQSVECEYQEWDGFWYPVKIVNREVRNRKVEEEQVLTVKEVDFISPIPALRFELSSLGLVPGERVSKNGIVQMWQNGQLVKSVK